MNNKNILILFKNILPLKLVFHLKLIHSLRIRKFLNYFLFQEEEMKEFLASIINSGPNEEFQCS